MESLIWIRGPAWDRCWSTNTAGLQGLADFLYGIKGLAYFLYDIRGLADFLYGIKGLAYFLYDIRGLADFLYGIQGLAEFYLLEAWPASLPAALVWRRLLCCTRSAEMSEIKARTGGLQRDVVYLGWPIAPSYKSPRRGEGAELRVSANELNCTQEPITYGRTHSSVYESLALPPKTRSFFLSSEHTHFKQIIAGSHALRFTSFLKYKLKLF